MRKFWATCGLAFAVLGTTPLESQVDLIVAWSAWVEVPVAPGPAPLDLETSPGPDVFSVITARGCDTGGFMSAVEWGTGQASGTQYVESLGKRRFEGAPSIPSGGLVECTYRKRGTGSISLLQGKCAAGVQSNASLEIEQLGLTNPPIIVDLTDHRGTSERLAATIQGSITVPLAPPAAAAAATAATAAAGAAGAASPVPTVSAQVTAPVHRAIGHGQYPIIIPFEPPQSASTCLDLVIYTEFGRMQTSVFADGSVFTYAHCRVEADVDIVASLTLHAGCQTP